MDFSNDRVRRTEAGIVRSELGKPQLEQKFFRRNFFGRAVCRRTSAIVAVRRKKKRALGGTKKKIISLVAHSLARSAVVRKIFVPVPRV